MYFFDDDDDSDVYQTTASQDERIEQQLRHEKDEERTSQVQLEEERKEQFEEAFAEKEHEIFHLPGLTFLKFTHLKVRFYFEPSKVATRVSKKVKFYCTLKYYKRYGFWNVRRNSIPFPYKKRIYPMFYRDGSVDDDDLPTVILRIYIQLKAWAQKEEEYRIRKFERYQNGEDVFLDSDDEELFLTEEERRELHDKRMKVLQRMIPPVDARFRELPPETPPRRRKKKQSSPEPVQPRRKRQRPQLVISDSD
ncbi:hypothetical protein NQ315_006447 [Exocentrus adspersus]|uniref:Uncharacterized protein n=1 Tax=Exocentrus adspersus TaxID=1586481 RepID=A0AAV8VZZ0_9CUCU|nr:hypothetical protein NQ315_006447 [Exocentrus adspersus]